MKITEKIIKFLNRNNPELIADNVADSYQERKKNGEKDPMDLTAEEIMKILNAHPDKVKEILANILEHDKIPDKVFEKVAKKISESEKIPDSVIPDVVNMDDTNIADESLNRIIKTFDGEERINLIKNVEDEQKKEENIKNELKILYKVCGEMKNSEVVERISNLKGLLNNELSIEIQNLIKQVVAKKMAENYYTLKTTSIYGFTGIIPIEKMLEGDLPTSVEKEYIEIEDIRGSKENYDKKKFKKLIINEMAKEIMGEYKKTGVFVIPHVKGITKEEEKYCLQKIQTIHDKKLSKKEIIDIENQIEGKSIEANQHEKELMDSIRKMSDKKKKESIVFLTRRLESEESLITLSMMEESGLIDKLNELSEDKRKKTIEIMRRVIERRKSIAVVKSPKIQNQQLKTHKKEPEGR